MKTSFSLARYMIRTVPSAAIGAFVIGYTLDVIQDVWRPTAPSKWRML
ncbi:MAG: hypothetical protein C0P68_000640 [Bacillota bacterium]